MKSTRFGLGLIATAFGFMIGAVSAFAAPAVITYSTSVFSSPAKDGSVIGSVSAGEAVDVGSCAQYWCQIASAGVTGWVPNDAIALSGQPQPQPQPVPQPQPQPQPQPVPQPWPPQPQPQPFPPRPPQPQPWPQPQPPRPQPPVYEDAGACFYSERNFGGSSFCLDEGESLNSFRTWDNRIRSVEIFGGARVDLCTDRNMFGNCVTLRSDTSRLPSGIDRRASSVEVY
jgi:hypothetical protein